MKMKMTKKGAATHELWNFKGLQSTPTQSQWNFIAAAQFVVSLPWKLTGKLRLSIAPILWFFRNIFFRFYRTFKNFVYLLDINNCLLMWSLHVR